jgi:hypothetical protein
MPVDPAASRDAASAWQVVGQRATRPVHPKVSLAAGRDVRKIGERPDVPGVKSNRAQELPVVGDVGLRMP